MENAPINNGKTWTVGDDWLLLTAVCGRTRLDTIAFSLGRSQKAIAARLHKYVLPRSGDKKDAVTEYLRSIDKKIYDYETCLYFAGLRRRKNTQW